jgi:AcrR family transcriptional regulator
VPKLWNQTIESHRHAVRDAILDTTAALVAEHGLLAVTMSQIAEGAGIGRATLYKYFPDVESVLLAWHERQIGEHVAQLTAVRDGAGRPVDQLRSVLLAYGRISRETSRHHGCEVAMFLHRDPQVVRAQQQLLDLLRDLLAVAATAGEIRDDVAPDELATYCLHAVAGAGNAPTDEALARLVLITLDGLRATR